MATDNLILEISPALLEAMDIPGEGGKVDYFRLLGLQGENFAASDVDRAVMTRSKALRPWQNSPQHGDETIKLLPMLHRIAAILKDPQRREAYSRELDRVMSGAKGDPLTEFRDMVRAASAGGVMDQASKTELIRYATTNGIPMAEAGRILSEIVTAVSGKAAEAVAAEKAWEFQVTTGEEGPEAFRDAVGKLFEAGGANEDSLKQVVADASKFGISRDNASTILKDVGTVWFRKLILSVARDGVLNNNQARLLMPKAAGMGLDSDQAYQIISDYTFTGATQADLSNLQLTTPTFESSEIEQLLEKQKTVLIGKEGNFVTRFLKSPAGIAILAVVALGGLGYFIFQNLPSGSSPSGSNGIEDKSGKGTEISATPKLVNLWDNPKPDPASGALTIEPEQSDDPPAFQIKITEVTCLEYQKFLLDTLYRAVPEGWGIDFSFPAGKDNFPVTGLRWADAMEYCKWKAKKAGLSADQVRLPTTAEFNRLLRAPIRGGLTATSKEFWKNTGLARLNALDGVQRRRNVDALFFPTGQVFDLLTNAAEWGMNAKDNQRAVLGGAFSVNREDFDLLAPRFADPEKGQAAIGFRYVIVGAAK